MRRSRRHPKSFFALLAVFLACPVAPAQVFEIEGRYWFARSDSQVRVERFGLATDIDLKKDLEVDDQGFPEARITWSSGATRLRFDFTPIRYSGDQNVTRTIVFNGRTYALGTRVISKVDINNLRLTWTYFLLRTPRLKIGPQLEGNGFLQDLSLNAPALGLEQSSSLSVGAPAVGLAVEFSPTRRWRIQGEVAGISVGRYGYFLRSEAGVRLTPARHVGISAGYRTMDLNADYERNFARLRIHGPFVGASIHF